MTTLITTSLSCFMVLLTCMSCGDRQGGNGVEPDEFQQRVQMLEGEWIVTSADHGGLRPEWEGMRLTILMKEGNAEEGFESILYTAGRPDEDPNSKDVWPDSVKCLFDGKDLITRTDGIKMDIDQLVDSALNLHFDLYTGARQTPIVPPWEFDFRKN